MRGLWPGRNSTLVSVSRLMNAQLVRVKGGREAVVYLEAVNVRIHIQSRDGIRNIHLLLNTGFQNKQASDICCVVWYRDPSLSTSLLYKASRKQQYKSLLTPLESYCVPVLLL